ncbi:hypothetical protein F5B22DRAFT_627720 [Xylaria bambusicola]|uniref:uncharacterized protein n=1 Tax=Xylaria bambusicola TaxID=326684 RepID=UPI002008CF20|nr:uncharacterized protein F5B22DRAFT_627720 [Xylaria bambusicola]KAI0505422.1 hypothetical protein F5B22DRAFT_627720 [Xylaria bambusicola]
MKSLSIALALSTAYARAQDLKQTIVGCVDLECPASSAAPADDNCTVSDKSFSYVGLTRIPTENKDLEGKISWTKGFNVINTAEDGRTFDSVFYFGTTPDLDLGDTGACAVFLHGIENELSFDKVNVNVETAQGTCSDAMGPDCVNALVERAKKLFNNFEGDTPTSEEACSKLKDDLQKNIDDACASITKEPWTNVSVSALSGEAAYKPLSGDKNSSSTCWPVLPKENQLTLAGEYQTQGSDKIDEIQKALYSVTPILTVFFPTGKQSIVSEVDASLSCLKVVGPSRASADAMDDGSGDPDNGVSKTMPSHSALFGLSVGVMAAALLL